MTAFLVLAFIVMLPVGLWVLDRQVIHGPCPRCRKSISRRAAVCPYCQLRIYAD